MRYTFSDGEEEDSDIHSGMRSTRNSGYGTPQENGPTVTASGRQVKARVGGMYGETMLVDQRKELESEQRTSASAEPGDDSSVVNGRQPRGIHSRSARGRYAEGLESESESDAPEPSEKEWSGNEDEPDDDSEPEFEEGEDEDEEMSEVAGVDDDDENTQESLVVQLRYRPGTKLKLKGIGEIPTQIGGQVDGSGDLQVNGADLPVQQHEIPHTNGINGINGEHKETSMHPNGYIEQTQPRQEHNELEQAMDLS